MTRAEAIATTPTSRPDSPPFPACLSPVSACPLPVTCGVPLSLPLAPYPTPNQAEEAEELLPSRRAREAEAPDGTRAHEPKSPSATC